MIFRSSPRRAPARAGLVRVVLLSFGLMWAPLATAQDPAPSASPKLVAPKECPPPEGFRAILHLLDNNSGILQMYPLPGLPMPKNMFAPFGRDMIPKCAMERTIDDVAKFRTECAKLASIDFKGRPTTGQLLQLGSVVYRGFKRWQFVLLEYYSKYPEYEFDGSKNSDLIEFKESLFATALDNAKRFLDAMTTYLANFKGVENDAVDAKKRLDDDEKRNKPRPAKDIAKDQAKVADYERRFKENKELMESVSINRGCFDMLSKIHSRQKWSWPGSGDPAVTLSPLIRQSDALIKQIGGK